MIFDFLKKEKTLKQKKEIIKVMVLSMNIPETQKTLYIEALEIVNSDNVDNLYKELVRFTQSVEIKNLEEIKEKNFSEIKGLKKKEAKEKQQELNAFSFLLHNI